MSLRNGKEFLMIPGPTNVPDEVLRAMHRPAVDIYEGPLLETTEYCLETLKSLFKTKGRTYIYAANGHGAWDAALSNTLKRGDKVLVLQSGLFATNWGGAAEVLGLEVEVLPGSWERGVSADQLKERLEQDKNHEIAAILTVQIDTASGVWNDVQALRAAIDVANHPALFMVDAVASLGCVPFEMDAWGVDVALTGSQKGLMSPPGLAFVAAGSKAVQAHASATLKTHYTDWTFREGVIHYQKYCGTPPEHLLFAFRKALELLFDEGLENAWRRHSVLAEATRRAVEVWADKGALAFGVVDPKARANSVTVVHVEGEKAEALRSFTKEICGVTIGGTIGDTKGQGVRIAHMGHVNAVMLLGTLAAIELGLQKLEIPHGSGGVQTAIDFLATSV